MPMAYQKNVKTRVTCLLWATNSRIRRWQSGGRLVLKLYGPRKFALRGWRGGRGTAVFQRHHITRNGVGGI